MIRSILPAFIAMALVAGCAAQSQQAGPAPASTASASIPFVDFGNINDWRADGTKGIYIQSDNRQWYYATFWSACLDLTTAEHVGFRTNPPMPMDKFDSIIVGHQECNFRTLEKSPGPPGTKLKAGA